MEALCCTQEQMGLIFQALVFAAHKHRDQRRKDLEASPYINHPIQLAYILINEAGVTDTDVIVAALLHDTIEDTATTPEELAAHFGPHIRDLVLEVTDDKRLGKAARKRQQIVHAAASSPKARLVKLADKIANVRDLAQSPPPSWSRTRIQEYFEWAKAVVDRLRGSNARLEALFDEAYAKKPR